NVFQLLTALPRPTCKPWSSVYKWNPYSSNNRLYVGLATHPGRGSAARPPPPVVAPLASSLCTPSRGDPPLKACGRKWAASPPARHARGAETRYGLLGLGRGRSGYSHGDSLHLRGI